VPKSSGKAKKAAKASRQAQNSTKAGKKAGKTKSCPKKPYASCRRPDYGKDQVQNVWDAARHRLDGKVRDPNTGKVLRWTKSKPRTGQWDMGHKKNKKYSKLKKKYMDGKITTDQFRKEYQNPNNYHPEDCLENQGHGHE
jgi:NAD+--asparagine ADP-ribosyltransferase